MSLRLLRSGCPTVANTVKFLKGSRPSARNSIAGPGNLQISSKIHVFRYGESVLHSSEESSCPSSPRQSFPHVLLMQKGTNNLCITCSTQEYVFSGHGCVTYIRDILYGRSSLKRWSQPIILGKIVHYLGHSVGIKLMPVRPQPFAVHHFPFHVPFQYR